MFIVAVALVITAAIITVGIVVMKRYVKIQKTRNVCIRIYTIAG